MTIDARRAERHDDPAVADEEDRHRLLFDEAVAGIWLTDAAGRLVDVNPSALLMLGYRREALIGRDVAALLRPEDARRLHEARAAAPPGLAMSDRFAVRHADGRWLALDFRHAVTAARRWQAIVRGADPYAAALAAATAQRQAETLIEGMPQLVWRAIDEGAWIWSSAQWTAFTGLSLEASLGLGWLDAFHPDDRETARTAWREARGAGRLQMEARLRHAESGTYRWFQTRAAPVRDAGGAIVQWFGTSTDVDDIKQLQQRQQELVAELQHRTRNVLTIVRSVFNRTVEAGGPLEEVVDHFRGRLDSLARTQVMVTQSPQGGLDLESLVRDELLSVGIGDGTTLSIAGPEVRLMPPAAESIGLAIHELTTNSVKYGALRTPGATLTICWSVEGAGAARRLSFAWVERGVPAVSVAPERAGFGRELIEEALPYRLGAETRLDFKGGGVTCRIVLPLPDAAAQ
jgi:PAS domain S-box-containing protein